MKVLITILFCFTSTIAFASEPLASIWITDENAASHGFQITSKEGNGYYEISWRGPQSVNGCYAAQSSYGVFNSTDLNALGSGSTIIFDTREKPSGFFNQLNNNDIALLTISYRCADTPSKGIMFILESIKGKLITSKGSG